MRPRRLALALLFLPLLANRGAAQCPDGSPPPCGRSTARRLPAPHERARSFVLLPFRNVSRRPEQDWLTDGAPLMLGQALGQFRDLHVVSEEQLHAARRRLRVSDAPDANELRALAEATGGWTAVTGTVIATGRRLRVALRSTDIPTGRLLVSAEQQVDSAVDIRGVFDALAVRVLEPAGVAPGGASLVALTTRSVDAYRAYLRGVSHYNATEVRDAVAAFEEAVRLDSTFALAWASLSSLSAVARGFQDALVPQGMMYRSIERAVRSIDRLPPNHAVLVRALQLFARAQIDQSQDLVDSLVAAQPNDLMALELSASLHGMGMLVGRSATDMAADGNESVRLAQRLLAIDPGRRVIYSLPVLLYGLSAGAFWGEAWAETRPFTALPFMLMAVATQPQAVFVPLMMDSIVMVPRDSFRLLSDSTQLALRRRGAGKAMEWVQQWLASGPRDPDAHLWASRIFDLQGNYAAALRAFEVADSIGIQSSLENVVGRRLSLVLLTQDYEQAGALADSLLRSGAMDTAPMISGVDRRWSYGGAALLLSKRFARAGELAALIARAHRQPSACEALFHELAEHPPPLPRQVRAAIMETVNAHIADFRAVPALAPCERAFGAGLAPSP